MNRFELIELFTILQLNLTIRNSSEGNNISPQAINELVKYKKGFYTRPQKVQLIIQYLPPPPRALKIIYCGPWPKRLCTSDIYTAEMIMVKHASITSNKQLHAYLQTAKTVQRFVTVNSVRIRSLGTDFNALDSFIQTLHPRTHLLMRLILLQSFALYSGNPKLRYHFPSDGQVCQVALSKILDTGSSSDSGTKY